MGGLWNIRFITTNILTYLLYILTMGTPAQHGEQMSFEPEFVCEKN